MQRLVRSTTLRLCFPLAMALAAGCVTVEDQPELATVESGCGDCLPPPVVDWVPGAADPDELFPRDLRYLHVQLSGGDERHFFALGVGGGQALWLYRVQMADQSNILGAIAGAADAHHRAGLLAAYGVVGGWHGPPPPPTDPGGDPPFRPEMISLIIDAVVVYEQQTQQLFDQLSQVSGQ